MANPNQKDQRNQETTGNKANQKPQDGQTTPKKTDPNNPQATDEKAKTGQQPNQNKPTSGTDTNTNAKQNSPSSSEKRDNKYNATDVQEQDIEGEGVLGEGEDLEEAGFTGENKGSSTEKNRNTNQNSQKGNL